MVEAFRSKFAIVAERVGLADLASTLPERGETKLNYINRWRNFSIRCERRIDEREAVELLMKNIDNWSHSWESPTYTHIKT
jgi:hypothetical protein